MREVLLPPSESGRNAARLAEETKQKEDVARFQTVQSPPFSVSFTSISDPTSTPKITIADFTLAS
jgi:hypothetical protein